MEIEADKGKDGLKSAIAALHDPAAPVPGTETAEQISLLPDLPLDAGFAELGEAGPRRGPGRPPGAKNKNTEEWRKYLLSRHRNPLEVLAQTYSCSVQQLAKALGRNAPLTFDQALELYKLQITAAKELAPYVAQKMPQAIEAGEGGLIQLVINTGQAAAQGVQNPQAEAIKILNSQDEENQLLTEADFEDVAQSRHTGESSEESEGGK